MLWTRTIGSTVVGQGVDSLIFYPLAFLGARDWTNALVVQVLFTQWALKVAWEVLLTPVTYAVSAFLKRARGRRRVTTRAPISRRSAARRLTGDGASGADRLQQALEQPPPVGAAMGGFDHALGVRHHAEHVAGLVDDAGDVARRSVDGAGVAERDAAFAFQPVERLGIGGVIAVVMGDRDARSSRPRRSGAVKADWLFSTVSSRRGRRSRGRHCASARRAAAPPRSAPGSRCRRRAPARPRAAASTTARITGDRAAIAPERR